MPLHVKAQIHRGVTLQILLAFIILITHSWSVLIFSIALSPRVVCKIRNHRNHVRQWRRMADENVT